MTTKEEILKGFEKEEYEEVIKVYENMIISQNKDIPVFMKFFTTPNIWSYFINNFSNKNFEIEAISGIEDGDRRLLSFNNIYNYSAPFKLLKFENNSKFNDLTHRDYLGAIMSLGINRNKLGDIIVKDNYAIASVYEDIVDYLLHNLQQVKHCPITVNIVEDNYKVERVYDEFIIIISNLRIDALVSKLAKVSRNDANEIIKNGKVSIDYVKVKDKSKEVYQNQIVTISKLGKFLVGNIDGTTKSGRIKINIKKYK